ncbi:hypothetical protein TNCV_4248911 [Trichonephila clavipes]|nr:hypothetical protein TNCV_4248911 [Trichonephila clavipes]
MGKEYGLFFIETTISPHLASTENGWSIEGIFESSYSQLQSLMTRAITGPKEELLGLLPLKGQTSGEDIANAVIECMDKHHIPLDKIGSITKDGAKTLERDPEIFAGDSSYQSAGEFSQWGENGGENWGNKSGSIEMRKENGRAHLPIGRAARLPLEERVAR